MSESNQIDGTNEVTRLKQSGAIGQTQSNDRAEDSIMSSDNSKTLVPYYIL